LHVHIVVKLERTPTLEEIEVELQLRKDDAIRKAGKSHMSDGSRGGGKVDLGSPSSLVSHMGEDRGLLKRMDGLQESMKLIMTTLNIGGVENRRTRNEDVGTTSRSTHTGNLVKDNTDVESYINCTQPKMMKDDVIVDARTAVKMG